MVNAFSIQTSTRYKENVSRLISWGHWFVLFNIVLAMAIAIRYVMANPWPATGLGQLYLLVSWIGHFGYIGFICFLLTIFPLTFVFSNEKVMRGLAVLLATTILTLLLIDTQIYQLLKFHITPFVWDVLFAHTQKNTDINWSFLFIAIPVIFFLELLFSTQAWRMQFKRRPSWVGRAVVGLFVSCFLITHLAHIWADAIFYGPITAQKSNFPLSYPMTARTFLAKHGWLDLEAFKQKAMTQEHQPHSRLQYPLAPLQVQPIEPKMNLLLITLRGLRQDAVNNIIMPNLVRFAAQHQQFTHHIAGDNQSDTSLFSLFYGLPGQYADDMLADKRAPLLIDELQRQDYLITSFIASQQASTLYHNGIFSGVRDKKRLLINLADDATVVKAWSQWFHALTTDRPWFSYINLTAPGNLVLPTNATGPFQPELKQLDPFSSITPAQQELLINRYKNAAFFADQQLGLLLDQLYQRGHMDDTVVVITADHGFEFNESNRGSWGAGSNYSRPQLAVPMILAWPGKSQLQSSQLTGHIDLVPTLLRNLLGASSPEHDFSTGASLFDLRHRDWLVIGDNRQFVIYSDKETTLFDRQGNFRLFDSNSYQELEDGKANMPMLLQVISDLNRFRGAQH